MNKQSPKRSVATLNFGGKPLGKDKALTFAAVEGMILNSQSAKKLAQFEARGLKGDDLRSAIRDWFKEK
jgi:hypothetical protein